MASKKNSAINRQTRPNPIAPDGWQIVYTGFIMIMLTYFILLTSFASMDQSKITRFASSFSNAVNVLDGGKSMERGGVILDTQTSLLATQDLMTELFEKVRRVSLEENLDQIQLQRSKQGIVMTLKDMLLFDAGQAGFKPEAYPRLEKIARLIQRIDAPVEIQGHTDNRPIRSAEFASNWELSTARAVRVLRYLIEVHGMEAKQLSAVGFAHFQLVAANDSAEHRAMNRRVNIIFKVER